MPAGESAADFLARYDWREDAEGKDCPEKPVFFPLFCAATEGNLSATKSLKTAAVSIWIDGVSLRRTVEIDVRSVGNPSKVSGRV